MSITKFKYTPPNCQYRRICIYRTKFRLPSYLQLMISPTILSSEFWVCLSSHHSKLYHHHPKHKNSTWQKTKMYNELGHYFFIWWFLPRSYLPSSEFISLATTTSFTTTTQSIKIQRGWIVRNFKLNLLVFKKINWLRNRKYPPLKMLWINFNFLRFWRIWLSYMLHT